MSADRDVYGLKAETIAIPATGASALYFAPLSGQLVWTLKMLSGSSVSIVGTNYGATLSGSAIDTAVSAGHFYPLGSAEAVSIDGACAFYVVCTGATGVLSYLRGFSAGRPQDSEFQVPNS
jgi:hypothetical protein